MKRTPIINMADLIHWWPYLCEDTRKDIQALPVPETFGGKPCIQDLNEITLEQLAKLQVADADSLPYVVGEALYGADRKTVDQLPAAEFMGICNMVARELEIIGSMFESLGREFTSAEIRAGAMDLNHGIFGLADWYAQRMNMQNHDDAFATPWLRVWQCRKNDQEMNEYRERLQEIQLSDMKNRH